MEEDDDEDEDDDDDTDAVADGPFSQDAQEIRRLERTGAMSHVVGETSLLSQEILILTQPDAGDGDSNDIPNRQLVAFACERGCFANDDCCATAACICTSKIANDNIRDTQETKELEDVLLQTPQTPLQTQEAFSLRSNDSQLNMNMNMQTLSQITFGGSLSQTTLGLAMSQEVATDGPAQSLSQGTFQASQLSAMSVLMDAAELMSKSQNTICGVVLSGSLADSQVSTAITSSKMAPAISQTQKFIPKRVTRSFQKSHATVTSSVPNKLSPSTVHVHIKATPNTMIVNVPSAAVIDSNSKKRKSLDSNTPTESAVKVPSAKATTFKSASRNSKSICDNVKSTNLSPQKKKRLQKERERQTNCEMAQCAAQLAAETIASPEVAKNLLLSMALVRINPRAAPAQWPARGSVICDGFFWGTYPPLETILRRNMREYYELSTTKCQSKSQQKFNNRLTVEIRAESDKYGWVFAKNFDDKVLRDRIRCFFKTHIQK